MQNPHPGASRVLPPAPGHRALFYEEEGLLVGAIARFLAAGLLAGDRVLVVATPARSAAVSEQLVSRGFDVAGLAATGRLTFLDARETLASFCLDGMPVRERFEALLGPVVERVAASGSPLRIYGEMVDLLWADGSPQAALLLEEFWNGLARAHPFSLLCAYSMAHFLRQANGEWFRHVCEAHTEHEIGPAHAGLDGVAAHHHEPAQLRQRVRTLEAEVLHRVELEEALRQALRQQRRAEEELQAAVHFSEMFVGILGHDLRNPLMAISGAAELIARRADVSQQLSRPLGRILTSAARMSRMIDQILDFTRLRLGKGFRLDYRAVDLAGLVRAVVDELDGGEESGIVEVACFGNTHGSWDPDRLAQLASNLVGNALQHRLPASPVRIRIDGSAVDRVAFEVRNQGAVPAELLPVLFEPFRDSGRRSAQSSGLGLGLFISRQIAEAHRGTIGVDSADERGTCFRVELPRV